MSKSQFGETQLAFRIIAPDNLIPSDGMAVKPLKGRCMKRLTMMLACFLWMSFDLNGQQINPNEKLEYLVGRWELNVEEANILARMDFEWGPNKTYVFSRNTNSRNGSAFEIENTAMISWDGVAGTFVISSVYNGPGDLLVGRGTMDISSQTISRDILLHYGEGEKIPFVNRLAQKGGGKLRYRQYWEIVDERNFKGKMEVLMDDGEWKVMFEEERWQKVK